MIAGVKAEGEYCIRDGEGFCLIANGCGILVKSCRAKSAEHAAKIYDHLCDQAAMEGRWRKRRNRLKRDGEIDVR